MKQWKSLSGTTALLLVLAGAAQADVTGAEVWANWKAAAEGMGQVLTPGSQSQDGGTLTIRDLQVTMELDEIKVDGTLAWVEFRDQPGGTVAITLAPSYDMHMAIAPEDGENADLTLNISQPDMKMTASGGMGAIAYDFTAPALNVSLSDVTVDGEPFEIVFNLASTDVAGRYDVTEGEMTQVTSSLDAGRITLDVSVREPGGSGSFTGNAAFTDVKTTSDGNLAMLGAMADVPALLAAGFASSGTLAHAGSTYSIDFIDGSENFQMSGKSATGSLSVAIDAQAVSYDVGSTGQSFTISGSDIPLPEIAASFAEVGVGLLMPLAVSDTPQDFGMYLKLGGLSVSDMIWGLADPTGALPHDPATIIFDLAGKANWLVDIMDPEATAALEDQMPGEIHALDITEIRVAVAGADLSGAGSFTFDNTDLETFEGIPAPTGSIDLTLVGANALLDKLVAMGLLPEDQAMGARMMMGMFARPGGGEDTLTSKIEVKGDGSISANGQRLQ